MVVSIACRMELYSRETRSDMRSGSGLGFRFRTRGSFTRICLI